MPARYRRAFALARNAARRVLRRRFRLIRLTVNAYRKLAAHHGAMPRVAADLATMIRIVRAWTNREYRTIPWKPLLYIVAAIVYFVNPVDVIPDVLTGLGFVDDAAVVTAVIRVVHGELVAFRAWESSRSNPLAAEVVERLPAAA